MLRNFLSSRSNTYTAAAGYMVSVVRRDERKTSNRVVEREQPFCTVAVKESYASGLRFFFFFLHIEPVGLLHGLFSSVALDSFKLLEIQRLQEPVCF